MSKKQVIRFIYFIILCLLWILLGGLDGAGHFPIFSILALLIIMVLSDNILPERIFNPLHFAYYMLWIFKEAILSGIEMTRIIWRLYLGFSEDLEPVFTEVDAKFHDGEDSGVDKTQSLGKLVLYANSITMTPGTFSIDTYDNKILVHSLNKEFAKGLEDGRMAGVIKRL